MPDIRDILDGLVQNAVEVNTVRCDCADVGGACVGCRGRGTVPLVEEDFGPDGFPRGPCDFCDGTGHCKFCTSGVLVPSPMQVQVAGEVLLAVITMLVQARNLERFSDMNEILDWASDYAMRIIRASQMAIDPEVAIARLREGAELLASVEPKTAPQDAGALSAEEIDDLLGDDS